MIRALNQEKGYGVGLCDAEKTIGNCSGFQGGLGLQGVRLQLSTLNPKP